MGNIEGKKIAGNFPAIYGDGNAERFALRREPNGVYLVDGRAIPSTDNATGSVNDSESIIDIHVLDDMGVGLLGSQIGVDIEK